MMISLNNHYRSSLLGSLLVMMGCSQSQAPAPAGINLAAPEFLSNSLRVDNDQLRPVVTLSDGQTVNMFRSTNGGWTGTTTVVSNQDYSISISWIERFQDQDLPLANLNENFSVGADAHVLNIEQSNYDTNIDTDGDGVTNLDEREAESDPFTAENGTTTGDTTGTTTGTTTGDTTGTTTGTTTGNTTGTTTGTTTGDTTGDTTGTTTGTTTGDTTGTTTGTTGATSPTVLIPLIDPDDAPEIDGQISLNSNEQIIGDWANAISVDINGDPLAIGNLMIDNNADHVDNQILRRWYAMHDGEYIYFLVLSDDTGLRFSDSDFPWHDDALELYIDGDNSKLDEYGDSDDIQVHIPLQRQNSTASNDDEDGRFSFGSGSTVTTLDLNFATGPGLGPDGIRIARWEQDIYEIRVSIASAGITINEPFGLELQINDDDDGNLRDGKWGWFHPPRGTSDVDFTFINPSIMGTAILQ